MSVEIDFNDESFTAIGRGAHMRRITEIHKMQEASEGIGSRVRRCIGNRLVRCLPPFVICECFKVNRIGYPKRPSRGGHKLVYLVSGALELEYSSLDKVYMFAGDLMSDMIGRGMTRSLRAYASDPGRSAASLFPDLTLPSAPSRPESDPADGSPTHEDFATEETSLSPKEDFEESEDTETPLSPLVIPTPPPISPRKELTARGVSILFDIPEPLKREDSIKLCVTSAEIVHLEPTEGVNIKLLSGQIFGTVCLKSLASTPVTMLDCILKRSAQFDLPVEPEWNAFIIMLEGTAEVQDKLVQKNDYIEFRSSGESQDQSWINSKNGRVIKVKVPEEVGECRFIFCAGKPLNQPIYRQGPFIDVSMDWIHQAFEDYTEKKNGFEERKPSELIDPKEPLASGSMGPNEGPALFAQPHTVPAASSLPVAPPGTAPAASELDQMDKKKDSCDSVESMVSASSGSSEGVADFEKTVPTSSAASQKVETSTGEEASAGCRSDVVAEDNTPTEGSPETLNPPPIDAAPAIYASAFASPLDVSGASSDAIGVATNLGNADPTGSAPDINSNTRIENETGSAASRRGSTDSQDALPREFVQYTGPDEGTARDTREPDMELDE